MNARDDVMLGLRRDLPVEQWKAPSGFDGFYMVSNHGRVMTQERQVPGRSGAPHRVPSRILKPSVSTSGYAYVRLWREGSETRIFVHRLVLENFVGAAPSQLFQCAHADGDPLNNWVENLRWATAKENQADRLLHGTDNRGEKHGMSKLTRDEVLSIRVDVRTNAAIARDFGIWAATVSRIKRRVDWSWL